MNLHEQKIIRKVLKSEYEKIRARNPSYSQRAFAKKVKVHSGTLVSILNGKRKISAKTAKELITNLSLDKNYAEWLSKILDKQEKEKTLELDRALIDIDRFTIISDPIHLNILNLLRTKNATPTVEWVAKKMSLSELDIEAVIDRLESANLLVRKGKKLSPTKQSIKTPENFSHHAIRSFHKNTLQEAIEKLDEVPVELRDFSSLTIPADVEKIVEVRELIKKFRDQVSFLLGSTSGKSVYKLSIQFYPVTREESKE